MKNWVIWLGLFSLIFIAVVMIRGRRRREGLEGMDSDYSSSSFASSLLGPMKDKTGFLTKFQPIATQYYQQYMQDTENIKSFHPDDDTYVKNMSTFYHLLILKNIFSDDNIITILNAIETSIQQLITPLATKFNQKELDAMINMASKYRIKDITPIITGQFEELTEKVLDKLDHAANASDDLSITSDM
jgi:hypothetical protein